MDKNLSREDFLICLRNDLVKENPDTEFGIKGLLQYRLIENKRHPDSMYLNWNKETNEYEGKSVTAKFFKIIYGKKEPSSDTIFNCWSYFRMFAKWRLTRMGEWVPFKDKELAKTSLVNLDGMFDAEYLDFGLGGHFATLRELFDELSDLQHSLANFMPACNGFNGCKGRDGKGNILRDNDMPDIYYKRAEKDFPDIYDWINKHMDEYCLHFFTEYKSAWMDGKANCILSNDDNGFESFKKSIKDAIECIKKRADGLYNKYNSYKKGVIPLMMRISMQSMKNCPMYL